MKQTRPLSYEEALKKCEETSKINQGRKFVPVKVEYSNGQEGWDVTPAEASDEKAS